MSTALTTAPDQQKLSERSGTQRDLAVYECAARRAQTPCGSGVVVWHIWGEGEPLLLLHGGAGSWNHWVRNIAALVRADRMVLVPDMPGFGDSAVPPDGDDADALPPWLESGLTALLGAARCDVVGFSFGAIVAGFLATQHPERVRSLVLVGASGLSNEVLPPLDLRPWHALPIGPQRDAVHRHNLRTLMLAQEESIDELAIRLHGCNVARDRLRKRRLMLTDALRQMLPRVTCPLAGIWGADDVLYRKRFDVVERALAHSPRFQSLTLIAEAGHWVQYERASRFNDALSAALALHDRCGG